MKLISFSISKAYTNIINTMFLDTLIYYTYLYCVYVFVGYHIQFTVTSPHCVLCKNYLVKISL